MRSLRRLSAADPPALGTTELAATSARHLQRVVDAKAALLMKDGDESNVNCLPGVVRWLFTSVGAPETQFRRKCMELFLSFTNHVGSAPAWLRAYVGEVGLAGVVAVAEGALPSGSPPALATVGEDGLPEVPHLELRTVVRAPAPSGCCVCRYCAGWTA